MNIVRPGDHVFMSMPLAFESRGDMDAFRQSAGEIVSNSQPLDVDVTFFAVGAKGSGPSVLFVIRAL